MSFSQNLEKCRKRYTNGYYDKFKAYDPGFRLTLGGVSRKADGTAEHNIRVKGGKYYRYTREHPRNKAKKKIDQDLQARMKADRELYAEMPSCQR